MHKRARLVSEQPNGTFHNLIIYAFPPGICYTSHSNAIGSSTGVYFEAPYVALKAQSGQVKHHLVAHGIEGAVAQKLKGFILAPKSSGRRCQ
eukprot:6955494-Pyramimonas_sp.AAC.2